MTLLTTLLLIVASVFTAPPDQQWGGPDSGASTIQIELITDADGFSDAWKRTHGGSLEGLPSVDFTQARVVLADFAAGGEQQHKVIAFARRRLAPILQAGQQAAAMEQSASFIARAGGRAGAGRYASTAAR